MNLTHNDIRQAIRTPGLSNQPLCIHSSLRSFGTVEGGVDTILDSLLAEDCTVLVPTFTNSSFAVAPPADPSLRPARNGFDPQHVWQHAVSENNIYTPATREIDKNMGALPAAVVARSQRVRGNHPLNSFAAIGPLAEELIGGQQPLQVYKPLEALTALRGAIILMGVGLERMTFLHFAEQEAGRTLFRRWANAPDGKQMVAVGSCSEGFGNFAPILAPFKREIQVGQSLWQVFPARETLEVAVKAIRANPLITHCADPACSRCNDAVQGGSLLTKHL